MEAGAVAAAAVPYLVAAAKSVGAGIWQRAEGAAVDSVADAGRRLLARLFVRSESEAAQDARADDPALAEVVDDLAASPESAAVAGALEYRVAKVLAASPETLRAVHALLAAAEGAVTASGDRSVAAREIHHSRVVTGDGNVVGDGNITGWR